MNSLIQWLKNKRKMKKYKNIKKKNIESWSKDLRVPYSVAKNFYHSIKDFGPDDDIFDTAKSRAEQFVERGNVIVKKINGKYELVTLKSLMPKIAKLTRNKMMLPIDKMHKDDVDDLSHLRPKIYKDKNGKIKVKKDPKSFAAQLFDPNINYNDGTGDLDIQADIAVPTKTSFELCRSSDMYDKWNTVKDEGCYYLTIAPDYRHFRLNTCLKTIESSHDWRSKKYQQIATNYLTQHGFGYYPQWSQKQVKKRAKELDDLDSKVSRELSPNPLDVLFGSSDDSMKYMGMAFDMSNQNKARDRDLATRLICYLQFKDLNQINQKLKKMDKFVNFVHDYK